MDEFQIVMLSAIGGFFASIIVGLVLGLLLPPSELLMDKVVFTVNVTTCAVVALAVAMTISVRAWGNPFAILPFWPSVALGALYVANVGVLRGVSLRKYRRWT